MLIYDGLLLSNMLSPLSPSSKAMLYSFLESKQVSDILETCYKNQIVDFLRDHVYVHEKLFARCYFLDVFAFDAWTNTPHEGTNRGAKYCENRVEPWMSLTESTKKLSDQDEERGAAKHRHVAKSVYKTPLHSSTSTVQHLQPEAEGKLQEGLDMSDNYMSIRLSSDKWLLLYGQERKIGRGNSPKPVFERVRVVSIDENGHISCSCGGTHRYGIADSHVTHVAKYYADGDTTFSGFSHHDVALRHHNNYCLLVATKSPSDMNDDELKIRAKLIKAHNLQVPLPKSPAIRTFDTCSKFAIGTKCDQQENVSYETVLERIDSVQEQGVSVLNYDTSYVQKILTKVRQGVSQHAAGFSQVDYNCDDDDNDFGGDESTAFEAWNPEEMLPQKKGLSAYAEAKPYVKEFVQALEASDPQKRAWALGVLQETTITLNTSRNKQLSKEPPRGKIVSAKLPSKTTKAKKQDYHRGGSS